jgi:hypothetical protein
MKRNLLIFACFLAFLMISPGVGAQLLLEENFDFTAGEPLVKGAVNSSSNSATTTTGWLTMSNSSSGTNSFNITAEGLTYAGYAGSGLGKALEFLDNNGQDVFKTFSASNTVPTQGASFAGPKTVYIAYLIKIPPGDKDGAEFFAGIKYSNSATDANYFGRMFARVSGTTVQFGITKSTTPCNNWTNEYPIDKTHLIVLKYVMGGLNGTSVSEETGKYDDKVHLFVNPAIGTAEPAATLSYENAADRDAYRYGSTNSIIGGLAALYFRTPGEGAIPALTIDGIRIGDSWSKVVAAGTTNIPTLADRQTVSMYVDQRTKSLQLNTGQNSFNQVELFTITGSKVLEQRLSGNSMSVNMGALKEGIYIVRLNGLGWHHTSKIIVQ